MFVTLSAWVINFVLDPILIFGYGPIPELGFQGAAWATFIAYTIAIITFFIFFWKTLLQYAPLMSIKDYYPKKNIILEIMRIGTPAGLNGISRPLSSVLLMKLIAIPQL